LVASKPPTASDFCSAASALQITTEFLCRQKNIRAAPVQIVQRLKRPPPIPSKFKNIRNPKQESSFILMRRSGSALKSKKLPKSSSKNSPPPPVDHHLPLRILPQPQRSHLIPLLVVRLEIQSVKRRGIILREFIQWQELYKQIERFAPPRSKKEELRLLQQPQVCSFSYAFHNSTVVLTVRSCAIAGSFGGS
jgi:hypothetical protein